MQWTAKAWIQSCVDRLPDRLSYPLYFRLQRHFGSLRRGRIDPTSRLLFGMEFCRQIVAQGHSPVGATFFELGTGWRLNLPIACWLCGSSRVLTADLNPYLRFALVEEDLQFMRQREDQLRSRLSSEYGDLLDVDRWHRLLEHRPTSAAELCALCGIEYQTPADARHTSCDPHSIDFHVSCNVFEHIPQDDLRRILHEANRITKPTGLLLHRVDHTDHFSHVDANLPPIHFLKYSDTDWHQYAGHRNAYVNRLREDDYIRMFRECGQEIRAVGSQIDADVLELLRDGFPLDARFRGKSHDTLSRMTSLFVAAPQAAA